MIDTLQGIDLGSTSIVTILTILSLILIKKGLNKLNIKWESVPEKYRHIIWRGLTVLFTSCGLIAIAYFNGDTGSIPELINQFKAEILLSFLATNGLYMAGKKVTTGKAT